MSLHERYLPWLYLSSYALPVRSVMRGKVSHEVRLRALRELRKHIADENDVLRLRELLLEINGILNALEGQVAKLEGRPPRPN